MYIYFNVLVFYTCLLPTYFMFIYLIKKKLIYSLRKIHGKLSNTVNKQII